MCNSCFSLSIAAEIITISDSEDNSEDVTTEKFEKNFKSQTPSKDVSTPMVDSDTENQVTNPEPIPGIFHCNFFFESHIRHTTFNNILNETMIFTARITRSYTRPNLKSYNEDEPCIVFSDQAGSSHLSADFPKSSSKPKFQVDPARIPRNIDKSVFYSNYLYKSMCFLCGCTDKKLAVHYARKHPDTEVFIARVSPRVAARIRDQNFVQIDGAIHGMCVFCEELKTFNRDDWMKHLLIHTGEQMYHCDDCQTPLAKKSRHGNCSRDNVHQIFEAESLNGDIVGFICNTCNYVQIQRNQMNKHLGEHSSFDDSFDDLFSRIVLVKSPE